jgi:hypothetical protein
MRSDHISACSRIKCPLRESLSAGMSASIGSLAEAHRSSPSVSYVPRLCENSARNLVLKIRPHRMRCKPRLPIG